MRGVIKLPKTVKLLQMDGDFGLHAADDIMPTELIGCAFIKFRGDVVATAIGGHLNHSEDPNCMLLASPDSWALWSVEALMPHEELTVDFRLYDLRV